MHEDAHDLTEAERREVGEILDEMALRGGRLTDPGGRPIPFQILRGRRFLVCDKGLVWRFAPEGSPQVPGQRTGTVRRNSAVEMWTGKWRRTKTPDGSDGYAKCLVWVPLDDNINGHPGITKLGWYRSEKGFKHPMADPDAPTPEEIRALEDRAAAANGAVHARMRAEGLRIPEEADQSEDPVHVARKGGGERAS